MTATEQAHDRLLNAVITFIGADQHGSKAEIRASVIEMHAAIKESQKILYPDPPLTRP
jgi:hypothetical protein